MAQRIPEKSRDFFYNNIKAGAESGWDFSNRWFIRNNNSSALSLYNISTQYIIPVDLNAILQQNARLLGEFHTLLGNNAVSCETFVDKHTALKFITINCVLSHTMAFVIYQQSLKVDQWMSIIHLRLTCFVELKLILLID